MKFRKNRAHDEVEINFIPLIDVMLVILIFLMATTTYSKFAELKINLPTADAEKTAQQQVQNVEIAITAGGQFSINGQMTPFGTAEEFAVQLRRAAGEAQEPMVIIDADAQASHQNVVHVMEAARIAGYGKLTFATQTGK